MNSFVTSVLVIAVKFLWLIFVVSLMIGLIILIKRAAFDRKRTNFNLSQNREAGYVCPCCNTRLTAEFKFCPNCKASLKDICTKCGRELQVGWRCCPICGNEKRR